MGFICFLQHVTDSQLKVVFLVYSSTLTAHPLSLLVISRSPTVTYIHNYLELLDKLLTNDITNVKNKMKDKIMEEKEDKALCDREGNTFQSYSYIQHIIALSVEKSISQ